ncbi:MAG: SecDF P1 head subdomain-containing protein [Saprospiraceae bacterium]
MKRSKILNRVIFIIYLLLVVSIIGPILRGDSPIRLGLDIVGGVIVSYRPDFSKTKASYSGKTEKEILETTKEIITDRLQRKLNTIPDVYINSSNKLIVSIPSVKGKEQVLDIVGKTYHLTERLVLNKYPDSLDNKKLYYYNGYYYELGSAYFTGDMIDPASIKVILPTSNTLNPDDRFPKVQLGYKSPYDKEYAEFTGKNVGKDIAILVDDQIEIVATLRAKIVGEGVLTGKYTIQEAENNATLLKSGSLPISLEIESFSEIGPTLGEEVLDKGLLAVLLSLTLLILFIILAYSNRLWLLVNGILSLCFLIFTIVLFVAAFGLTVDFAAIAGFVLALGMGMDSFIIIFESLIPKLNKAQSKVQLISNFESVVQEIYSFRREGRILFHAIVSTLLVIILTLFTDRIKFFGLAMLAGIGASFLTILFTRRMLAYTKSLAHFSGFSIFSVFRTTRTNIFKIRKPYLFMSIGAILCAVFLVFNSYFSNSGLKLGSDFHPGIQIIVSSENPSSVDNFISTFKKDYPESTILKQKLKSTQNQRYLITMNAQVEFEKDSIGETNGTSQYPSEEGYKEFGETGKADTSIIDSLPVVTTFTPGTKKSKIEYNDLRRLTESHGLSLLSVNSIDNKLSGNRFFMSLSIMIFAFIILGLYLFWFQKPIDDFFLKNVEGLVVKTHSHGWNSFGIFLGVIHDISFMLIGCFLLNIEINLTVIAAFITIIGYSVNDSIVLWGHIQNMANKLNTNMDPVKLVSGAIDSVLSRNILTSLSTALPVISILILDIAELKSFAIMVLIGTFFGTLSSIFIVGFFSLKTLGLKKEKTPPAPVIVPDIVAIKEDFDDLFNNEK